MSAELQRLVDERAIEQCLIRFARAMDYRDWAAFDDLVCEDATAEMGTGLLHGRAAMVALMRQYLDHCGPTQHLLGNVLVSVDGDEATSHAYVHDLHLPAGGANTPTFHTLGDYHDRWRRIDGVWRMTSRVKDNRAHVGSLGVFGAAHE